MEMNDSERYGTISHVLKKLGENRQYFGKVVIQKMFYFLTSHSKLPLPYEFYFYHFGPYSDLLKRDLDMMQLFGLIEIQEDPKKMGYKIIRVDSKPTQECEEVAKDFIQEHLHHIDKIITVFGTEEPADLELLATIHYVFEKTKSLCDNDIKHKQIVLKKVSDLKPKFPQGVIKKKYNFLKKRKFFE